MVLWLLWVKFEYTSNFLLSGHLGTGICLYLRNAHYLEEKIVETRGVSVIDESEGIERMYIHQNRVNEIFRLYFSTFFFSISMYNTYMCYT